MSKIKALQDAREQSGKTQAEAAFALGMSKQMYQKYEYGMSAHTIQTEIRIAKSFHTTFERLWSDSVGQTKANLT